MRKYLVILIYSLVFCSPALAGTPQEMREWRSPTDYTGTDKRDMPDEITVLANGFDIRVDDVGQSISVIGEDELDDIQTPDLTVALQRLPGVTFSRNGGSGSFTGVRVRGASSEQVLVLVDGIRIADVAAPGGGTDFGTLASSGFGKVELLRGSNSVVWGSEAIGGVVALTTRRINNGIEASVDYGARDTVNAQAAAGMIASSYEFALTGGYTETDGFSTAASGTEPDGFRQWRANGRARIAMTDTIAATLAGRYADSRVEFDGFDFSPPYGLVDSLEYSDIEEWSGRAGLVYGDERLQIDAGYAVHDIARDNYNPDFGTDPAFAARGRQQRLELKGRCDDRPRGFNASFGIDHAWDRFSTTYDQRQTANSTSAHVLLGYSDNHLNLAAGARLDDHSGFGSEVTFGANGSYEFARGWRLRASYGEGFKAPTLYQLYSDFGDEALKPERSKSWDIGIERGTRNDPLHLALTLFRRDSSDLIDFAACSGDQCETRPFGLFQNVGKARAEGFELELGARISERLRAQAAYSYVKAKDRTPGGFNRGNDLARRPRHAVSVAVDWETPLAGLKLGGDLRMVSDSYDDAGNFTRIDGHVLGTLRASLPVNDAIELYGRIENVTDEKYETVAGYGTPGRSAYVGARARF